MKRWRLNVDDAVLILAAVIAVIGFAAGLLLGPKP